MPRRTPTRRVSDVARLSVAGLGLSMLLTGCGARDATSPPASEVAPAATSGNAVSTAAAIGAVASTQAPPAASTMNAAPPALQGRTRELVNPDEATVVFLYYDLTGSKPPLDDWVEDDPSVKFAPAVEKAGRRAALKPQLAAGMAAVHDVGRLRLTVNANLSDYDPAYGEFTVRALAPSSYLEFRQFGQKVALRFTNGRTAQVWKVPAAEAQAIRDRLGYGSAELDVLVEILGVQPGSGGGAIDARVLEYELRDARGGTTLGHVRADTKG